MPEEKQKPDEDLELSSSETGGAVDEVAGGDRFRPEAIAARVDRIGEETDLDREARQEEQKLLERKKQQRQGKRGLEAAASKRLAQIGEIKVKRPSSAADAYVPEAAPLIERARRARRWIETHRSTFAALVAVGVLGVGGALGYSSWQTKRQADASALLAQGLASEHGHVSDKESDEDDDSKAKELYPTYKSIGDRRAAALGKYRDVESRYPGSGAAILARLAEAGLLLDQADEKGAAAAYEEVKASPLAQADAEVRGRALEGIGFAHELSAQHDPGSRDKHLDDALAAFKMLAQLEVNGFRELGLYHQARVFQAKGDTAKAVELLKDVHKRVTEPGESHPFSYLEFVVEDRLRQLDPSALPPKVAKRSSMNPGGPPGGIDTSNPQVQEIIRQLQEQQRRGGAPAPAGPR